MSTALPLLDSRIPGVRFQEERILASGTGNPRPETSILMSDSSGFIARGFPALTPDAQNPNTRFLPSIHYCLMNSPGLKKTAYPVRQRWF